MDWKSRLHLSLRSRAALTLVVAAVAGALAAGPAAAAGATSQFVALLDLDDNSATGCTVATANGPFPGVDQELVTTVDLAQSPPAVISVARQVCNQATQTFGAPIPITSPYAPPWPVGVDNGTDGSEVIETYMPLTGITLGNYIHLGFTSRVVGGTGQADATLTTTGLPGGSPILLLAAPIAAVPTLGGVGMLLLVLLLAASALYLLGKSGPGRAGPRGAVAALLLLVLGLGVAWGDLTPNGTVTGWAGIAPLAVDPVGDAPPNADMVALFGAIQNNILYLRFDAFVPGQPRVTSTTPANGAVNVPGTTALTVNFNEPVTTTATTFALQCGKTTENLTASPAAPGNSSTFTLTPSGALPAGLNCTLTVPAAQVTDESGLHPAADFTSSFMTDGPPAVSSTTPANGATSVSLAAPLSVTFSKAVNVTSSAFSLQCPSGTPETLAVSPAPPGGATTFTLTPSAALPAGTLCTLTVSAAQVTDVSAGTHMAADYTGTFTTDTAPTVTSTTPTDGATTVGLGAPISITFSKAVNVTASAFTLQCPTGTPETFTLSPTPPGGATTFMLTPSAALPANTTCTVTVVAAQVHDVAAGTPLGANFVFSYTTDTVPTVTSTTPTNGATQQSPATTLTLTFSTTMNVTASAFKLECPVGTPEAFTVAPAAPGGATTFTLTPTANLPSSTTCTVTVVANQVGDTAAGTNLAANYVFTFTTGNPPSVTSTTPANGATAVLATTAIGITFSTAVNVTGTAFTLQCPTGTPEAFTVSPAPPGGVTSFTLTPTASLPAGTTCTVTAVASQITDTSFGLHPSANYVFTFTTDTPPTVSSTTPAGGATSVALNTTIAFTFSKAVNTTATSFTLQCPSGTPVAFTVAPAPPGGATTFTLTPTANLPAGTTCVVTAVAAQIKDLAGTPLGANYTLSFTADTAPTVTSTTPAAAATSVALNSTVVFTFSKAVNVTATAFTLQCPSGTPAAFTLAPAPPGNATTFTLTPTAALPTATTCVATAVANQISDAAGTNLAASYNFSFTTATPPTVTSTTPANGATAVLATSPLSITFSQAVNVTGTAFTLQCPSGTPEAFTLSPAPPGGVATFTLTPSAALPAGTVCTVTAVASQITSASTGVNLQANDVWSFTTDTPPTVTSTTPANGATAVAITSTVTFNLSKAVNVTASAFTLQCPSGTPEAFTLSPAPPGGATTFTLTPSANLPAGTTCVATAVAPQIADLAGTHLAANVTTSFTTDTPPTVTSVTPSNGATGVLGSVDPTVTFNKAVNVTSSAFTLACPTGTPESITISPAPPGGATTFTLTPSANLPGGVVCTATVVANQVSDTTAGTPLASNFTWSFTTDPPPTVSSTVPANGATNFLDTSALSFTFNKAVNVTATAFTLQCPSGTPVTFTLSPAPPGDATTFTLTPSSNLPPNTACVATAVASQIADTAGTNLAANDTLSFTTVPPPPVANNDTYPQNVIGNVSINSSLIPYSVTTNDTSQVSFAITAYDTTSANGGTVSMTTLGANMGQFTYNPPAGFTGTDTFTYTITNTGGSATATVSMPVVGIIWFIDGAATAGDGRLATPFNSLAAFQAINDGGTHHPAANANIFLYDSGTAYTGPVTLLNGQKLIGQDATSSLSTISGLTPGTGSATLPATGGGTPNPVKITATGNDVTLGSGNTVWGMTLGNATGGTALIGSSVGSLKLRDLTISTTGAAVSLANGALDAILNSVSSGGGTNGIALTTTTGSFDIEGGGPSDPTNTTVGRTTAAQGGGTLTLGSGGTIQDATGAGILLSNATTVTLRNMVIQDNGGTGVNNGGDGINASGSSNLTLDNDLITGHTGNYGLYASTLAGLAIQHTQISSNATNSATAGLDIWNVGFGQETPCTTCPDGLTGTATVANSLFETSFEDVFGMVNHNASTASLTVTNSQFTGGGNEGLDVILYDTADVSASVSGSTLTNNPGGGFEYLGNNSSGGGTVTVTGSSFEGNGGSGGADISVFHQGAGKTVSFSITNNTTRQTLVPGSSASISVDLGTESTSTTVLQGVVSGNTVGKASITDSGSDLSSGIAVGTNAPGTLTIAVENNTVVQTDDDGLLVLASSPSTSRINLTATGNDLEVSPTDPNTNLGLELTTGGGAGTDVICANVSGNSKEIGNSGVAGIATTAFTGAVIQLQGYTGAANANAAIGTFLTGTATTVTPPGMNFGGGGTVEAAPSACPTPP